MKIHDDEPHTLTIDSNRPGIITAGNIDAPAEVEIINPDLPIATLEEGDGSIWRLPPQAAVAVPAERNKMPYQPIGVIPVDSIFSPIRRVNYQVQNTRVGQVTDYDKLTRRFD